MPKKRVFTPEERTLIVKRYTEVPFQTLSSIAEEFHCSKRPIRRVLQEEGVAIRGPWPQSDKPRILVTQHYREGFVNGYRLALNHVRSLNRAAWKRADRHWMHKLVPWQEPGNNHVWPPAL